MPPDTVDTYRTRRHQQPNFRAPGLLLRGEADPHTEYYNHPHVSMAQEVTHDKTGHTFAFHQCLFIFIFLIAQRYTSESSIFCASNGKLWFQKKKKNFFCSILSRISHTSVHCNSFIIQLFICFYLNMEITFVFCLLQAIVRENQEKLPAEIQPFTFPKDKTFKWE